jgi:hypothetical protein
MHLLPTKISKVLLSIFGRLKSIPHDDPDLTPEKWCIKQPCMKIRTASKEMIITQPLSSFWVYFLGFFAIGISLFLFQIQNGQNSRLWWGISLLLWGIGALLAGTSYQAFGYEIKCAGRKVCSWTSWWEVIYLMFQQVSINAMLVAIAYSCTTGTFQIVLLWYALVSSLVYIILACIGGIVPVKSLITFEFMLRVSTPVFFFFCFFNVWRYQKFRSSMDLVLLGSWMILICTMMAYWIYSKQGIRKKLWAKGIWFSENDVLHVFLIFWMIYIVTVVVDRIEDYATPSLLE